MTPLSQKAAHAFQLLAIADHIKTGEMRELIAKLYGKDVENELVAHFQAIKSGRWYLQ